MERSSDDAENVAGTATGENEASGHYGQKICEPVHSMIVRVLP